MAFVGDIFRRAHHGSRILMLLENNPYPHDGRVRREATALVKAGYHVTVISPKKPSQPFHETINGVDVWRYPHPKEGDGLLGYIWEYGYSLVMMWGLTSVVWVRHGFDVIHAHNPPDMLALIALLYKPFGVRFVFDHHDLSPEMYDARFRGEGSAKVKRVLTWLEKLSMWTADHVISTNQSYRKMALERGNVAPENATIVRNGPELHRVRLVEPDAELKQRGHIIGYVGEMGTHDGVDYLIRALHTLRYELQRTDFYAVIIGTGEAWDDLRALVTELDLDEHVRLTGYVTDAELRSYLSSADICVDPDPHNPFNDRSTMIKMTEYMALGKPIVCFDLTEHRFTAQDAAHYVAINDEAAFATGLADLMDDPERRATMGAFARKRAETVLAWQYSVPNLLAAYEKVMGKVTVAPTPAQIITAAKQD